MHEIINRQRKINIETANFQDFVGNIFSAIKEAEKKSAAIVFVSDRKMRELNKNFRSKNSTTDVLSFPYDSDEFDFEKNHLGDIVISIEQAKRQADENDLSLDSEIKQLILHGVLHLCGYDHETDSGEMNARELELRDKLEIN